VDTLPIINRAYDLYKVIVEMTEHMEKHRRYSLGNSLEKTVLDMLSELIMAKNAPKPLKAGYLLKASGHQETAILKLRLFLELKIANETQIFQAQSALEEIGRQLGGWLKSVSTP
jgi:hypothetical protein